MSDWKKEILEKWGQKGKKPRFKITDELRDRLAKEFKGQILYQEPMSQHTSIRIGGKADVFLKPETTDDLGHALKIARETQAPYVLMGSGSNTLVKDGGIRGFVMVPSKDLNQNEIIADHEDHALVSTGAGVGITAFVHFCRENGLTGVEELVGIPGTMGGAVSMNAGARGREIQDVIANITVLDNTGEIKTIAKDKLEFKYRSLKLPRSMMILKAQFKLAKKDSEKIAETIKGYQKLRVDSQPLNFPNLGSVFKNPEPDKKNGKATAGQLIDEAGLKNIRVGGARVSEKHANFIINERDATAKDVMVLINLVRDKVKEATGTLLQTEIKIVGDE